MKYNLNKLPVKTTNNFKINDLEIDLEIPKIDNFNDFKIDGDIDKIKIKTCKSNKNVSSKLGLEFNEYLDINITVPKNVCLDKSIFFNYDFLNSNNLIDKITFNFEEYSSANFVFIYKSLDDTSNFHHLFIDAKVKNNSCGNITIINMLNNNSYNFISMENDLYKSSNIVFNIIDLGGKVKLSNSYTNLLEESSDNRLNHLYIGKNNDIIDINYYLKNIGKNSINKMNVEGVLDDNCIKNFRGTIDFVSGCVDAVGEEVENCILLSDCARSRSLPQMLCGEENVIGTHGVSSGKVSDDKLFYIMSRGYSKKEAERLIVLANFSGIISSIKDEVIQKIVFDRIDELLQ